MVSVDGDARTRGADSLDSQLAVGRPEKAAHSYPQVGTPELVLAGVGEEASARIRIVPSPILVSTSYSTVENRIFQ